MPGPYGRGPARAAIAATLTAACAPGAAPIAVPYVGTVYPARPTVVQEDDYFQTMSGIAVQQSSGGSSAVLVVNLPGKDHRERIALTGRGAVNDMDKIPAVIEVWFACTAGLGQTQDAAVQAQQDYDAIIDPLRALIRNTPDLSAPESIWSSGEYAFGVNHEMAQPVTSADGMTVIIVGTVTWEVWQQVVGTNV